MIVGLIRADLHIPEAQSLKDKRRVVRSLKDRIFSHFNASAVEIEAEDTWQRAKLGIAVAGDDAAYVDGQLQKLASFIRQHPGAIVLSLEHTIQDAEF